MSEYFFSTEDTKQHILIAKIKDFDKSVVQDEFAKTQEIMPIFSIYRTHHGKYITVTEEIIDGSQPKNKDSKLQAEGEADYIMPVYLSDLPHGTEKVTLYMAQDILKQYKDGTLKASIQDKNTQSKDKFRLTI